MQRPLVRIAFLTVVLGIGGTIGLWSVRQNDAYRRDAEAMGRSPELPSPPLRGAEVARALQPRLVSAVTSSGRPVAGVKVYDFQLLEILGTSNAKGQLSVPDPSLGLALAPDGRMGMFEDTEKIVFDAQTALRLRLTDGRSAPGAGRKVTIVPTLWLPAYNEMGVVDRRPEMAPELARRFTRTTDAFGNAVFGGLAKNATFQVFVHLDSGRSLSFDKLFRAVTRKEIVVARDRRIEGRVLRVPGVPLAGVKVELAVTNDGRFPTLTRRWTTTDRDGRYRFEKLLTCGYSIRLDSPAETLGEAGWVDARSGTGPWTPRNYDGPPPAGEWRADDYLRLWPKALVTQCDFRWTKAANLDVELTLATPALELKRIFLRRMGEEGWSNAPEGANRVQFNLRPGTYEVYRETKRQQEENPVEGYLGKVTLAEGESKTVRFKTRG